VQYLPTKNECPDCGGKGTHFPNERFPAPCLTCKGRGCLLKVKHPPLKYFKVYPSAVPPKWGTLTSACFDLAACLEGVDKVTYYDEFNKKLERSVLYTGIRIYPGDRMMIPTGLILDIPIGYSVRIHNRSGMAIKNGLVLANHEGVIDSDYVDPTFLVMLNFSNHHSR
jgi:dUTPase